MVINSSSEKRRIASRLVNPLRGSVRKYVCKRRSCSYNKFAFRLSRKIGLECICLIKVATLPMHFCTYTSTGTCGTRVGWMVRVEIAGVVQNGVGSLNRFVNIAALDTSMSLSFIFIFSRHWRASSIVTDDKGALGTTGPDSDRTRGGGTAVSSLS